MNDIYRTIRPKFWTDSKVSENFTVEDRYMFLYLLTNPHTTICGVYEISFKQMIVETGYDEARIRKILDRLINVHGVIDFDSETREIIILHWSRYNWSSSSSLLAGVRKSAAVIKNTRFKEYVLALVDGRETVYRPSIDGQETSVPVTVTVTDTVTNKDNDSGEETDKNNGPKESGTIAEIIDYLNVKIGSHYKPGTPGTVRLIKARMKEGFSTKDFRTVIDKKVSSWGTDPKMQQYLRPETLFGSKFESYLNEQTGTGSRPISQRDRADKDYSFDPSMME